MVGSVAGNRLLDVLQTKYNQRLLIDFQFLATFGFGVLWEGLGSHFDSFLVTLRAWAAIWWFGRALETGGNLNGFEDPP